jgi:hypothetical protein
LERWFASLPEDWEGAFEAADLTEGRRLYTEGLVRQIELKPESAEAVTRTEEQAVRAVSRAALTASSNGAPRCLRRKTAATVRRRCDLRSGDLADELPAIDDSVMAVAPRRRRSPNERTPTPALP